MDNSNIEWTDHTFNPWRGCAKVSPGCDNCYAETLSARNPAVLGEWGKDAARVGAAEAYWRKPERWEREAERFYAEHGRRQRVFCASLGDVFESRPDLAAPRLRLLDLIRRTPSLDWQLLTKRPKNVTPLLKIAAEECEAEWRHDEGRYVDAEGTHDFVAAWLDGEPPANVWLGTSVEDQERANQRVPALLRVPAAVRFLSMEPLLGPVRLPWLDPVGSGEMTGARICDVDEVTTHLAPGIDWVIVGGESGPGARPMHPLWARDLRDQCDAAGVPFLFKQWGAWCPLEGTGAGAPTPIVFWRDDAWADGFTTEPVAHMVRLGKKAAGRLLDGREHNGLPTTPIHA